MRAEEPADKPEEGDGPPVNCRQGKRTQRTRDWFQPGLACAASTHQRPWLLFERPSCDKHALGEGAYTA
jgi:hypothetical protein